MALSPCPCGGARADTGLPGNEFWVDLYVNPRTPPTAVNQTRETLGCAGAVLENHATAGTAYNNITGPISSTVSLESGVLRPQSGGPR